ncbi:hypothetical protein TR2A62_3129 [Thalassobium sp. R2A62]|nr:hypothetical protein TR2A62_3129 [Thalassobium sp. R2A62]
MHNLGAQLTVHTVMGCTAGFIRFGLDQHVIFVITNLRWVNP